MYKTIYLIFIYKFLNNNIENSTVFINFILYIHRIKLTKRNRRQIETI